MNIRWYSWLDIVREVAITQGLDYDLGQVEAPMARRYAQAVNAAVEVAWKAYPWPGCCWVCRLLSINALFTTDTGDMALLLEQGWDLLALYKEDPNAAWVAGKDPEMVPVRETQGRTVVQGQNLGPQPWWWLRLAPPRFGIGELVTGREYRIGDLIYHTPTGEVWRCVRRHTAGADFDAGNPDTLPFPTVWRDWMPGVQYEYDDPMSGTPIRWYRRSGVLYRASVTHFGTELNEPNGGDLPSAFMGSAWEPAVCVWAPQRLPHFLLQAVLHGARAWLHEVPPLPRSALETQMEGWLAAEMDDLRYNRKQSFAEGGALANL